MTGGGRDIFRSRHQAQFYTTHLISTLIAAESTHRPRNNNNRGRCSYWPWFGKVEYYDNRRRNNDILNIPLTLMKKQSCALKKVSSVPT